MNANLCNAYCLQSHASFLDCAMHTCQVCPLLADKHTVNAMSGQTVGPVHLHRPAHAALQSAMLTQHL